MASDDNWQQIEGDLSELLRDNALATLYPLVARLQDLTSKIALSNDDLQDITDDLQDIIVILRHMSVDIRNGKPPSAVIDRVKAGAYIQPDWNVKGNVYQTQGHIFQFLLSDPLLSERYAPLIHKRIDFARLIEERTRNFVGRQFVFDALDRFTRHESSGYFIIKGEPGVGKTSLLAQLVKTRGYVHHFVVSKTGYVHADQFLENICAQVIGRFKLDRPALLPPEASRDGMFFDTLLRDVSQKLATDERAIIVVDALDEVDWPRDTRANVLYLPPTLPDRVFIVVTTRPREDRSLKPDRSQVFYLDPDSPSNREDVLAYISQFVDQHEATRARIAQWRVSIEVFAQGLLTKSEGNFMYLRYVLPAIDAGTFVKGTLDELPQGLIGYYEDHWKQMYTADEYKWIHYRRPVICYLAVAREAVSAETIADWARLDPGHVLAALHDWREFLHVETIGQKKRYRLYHASFQDFLKAKDEAQEINLHQHESDIGDKIERWFQERKSEMDSRKGGAEHDG